MQQFGKINLDLGHKKDIFNKLVIFKPYIFPPFSLIRKDLGELIQDQTEAVEVVSCSQRQPRFLQLVCETAQERIKVCSHQRSPVSPATTSLRCNTSNLGQAQPNSNIFARNLPEEGLPSGVTKVIGVSQRADTQTTTSLQSKDGQIFAANGNINPSSQM